MKYRHFKVADGPLVQKALAHNAKAIELWGKAVAFGKKYQAEAKYYESGYSGYANLAGFQPNPGVVSFDTDLWRRDKKTGLWVLRGRPVNKYKGEQLIDLRKELAEFIRVPRSWAVLDDLQIEHGISNGPLVVTGNRAHSAGFVLIEEMPQADGTLAPVAFVKVPWPETKGEDRNARFKEQVTFPDDWVEVKEWEMLRDIDLAETAQKAREQS